MHLRTSTVRRGRKTYRYAQLVQSYRRPDGMPMHRVIANLGSLSEVEVVNLKQALEASRQGQALVLGAGLAPSRSPRRILANLAWLDVAVLHRLWGEVGLYELLAGLLPVRGAEVPDSQVVESLVVHRCVAPGSKLAAVEWFAGTALPELLDLRPAHFNNTRVHRVLDALEAVESELQRQLPRLLEAGGGRFVALFGDITDTWFEGRGPPMALKGRDKLGVYRRRVGIALLCEQRGLPLRWQTLPGDYHDTRALRELARQVAGLDWAAGLPVVFDRAMGQSSSLAVLLASGLRFVTALHATEWGQDSSPVPARVFDDLDVEPDDAEDPRHQRWAREVARAAGFEPVREDRYVLDLGVVEWGEAEASSSPSRTQAALAFARQLAEHPDASEAALARQFDQPRFVVRRHRVLAGLIEPLQERVLAGEADAVTLKALAAVAGLDSPEQPAAFDRAIAGAAGQVRRRPTVRAPADRRRGQLRLVVHLNPERLVEERRGAAARLAEVEQVVARLNESLADPGCKRLDTTVLGDARDAIRKRALGDVLTPELTRTPQRGRTLRIARDEAAWRRHRRAHGLNVIAADPDLPHTAPELVELYFAKDAVEKDFQLIKSEVELHPIRHRTDPKVRAHVTLCMLALLLERVLEQRFRDGGQSSTAAAALDRLASCHLNHTEENGETYYQVTEPTPAQRDLLGALGMSEFVRRDDVAELIHSR